MFDVSNLDAYEAAIGQMVRCIGDSGTGTGPK